MEVSITPTVCQGEKAKFKGTVVMRMPSYEERMELVLDPTFEALMDRKEGEETNKNRDYIKGMVGLVKQSYGYYVKVDIKKVGGNKKTYTTVDDLRHSPECDPILSEVAMKLVNGFRMGND